MTPGSRPYITSLSSLRKATASRSSRPPNWLGTHSPSRARVVEVEHRGDGVDPDAVDVILAQPEQGVGDEEVADLVAPEVEDQRAPVGVRPTAGVGVLIERGAVEAGQRELVTREVRRDPVQEDPDALGVHLVDERPQVVGRAVARGRGVVAGDLVTPRTGERVGHHRQQLDVGEAQVLRVGRELVGQLGVGERAVVLQRVQTPGAEVDLVDRDGLGQRLARVAVLEERAVVLAPGVPGLVDDRGGLGRNLGLLGIGVGLEQDLAVLGEDLVLVALARADVGEEQLPDAARAHGAHRVQAAVPGVEVPDHADRPRGRRPHRERRALRAAVLDDVGAEALVELLVTALAHEMEVQLADRGQERVGVLQRELAPRPVVDLELVRQRQLGALDLGLEQTAGVDLGHRNALAAAGLDRHRLRRRAQRAHDHAALGLMGAEDRVGLGVLPADESFEVVLGDGRHAASRRRAIPATGIGNQSGRLSSSYCSS